MTQLTNQQLDEIATRAAHLHEYGTLTDQPLQTDLDQLTGTDIPALLDAIRRLTARQLTEGEYSAAWHAVEGAAGEEGADPATILHAVLNRLGIALPGTAAPKTEELSAAELLALAAVLEIPRPDSGIPYQLRRIHGHGDRWAICDREGRRWHREYGWVCEPQGIDRDEARRDATRYTLAEAVPLAKQLADPSRIADKAQPTPA